MLWNLTLFFALAEREATIVSIRTKAALDAKRARGEAMCGDKETWGKKTGANRKDSIAKAVKAAATVKREAAQRNPENVAFKHFIDDWQEIHGAIGWQADWIAISGKLNSRGYKTATGLPFTPVRAQSMYRKIMKLYA